MVRSNSSHAGSNAKNKARLYPSSGYRANGHNEIKGGSRKARYNKTNEIRDGLAELIKKKGRFKRVKDAGQLSHARRYHFDYKNNFVYGRGPYTNQAHHMLPQEFWKSLTTKQKNILKKVDYDIDNGKNIIFLPANDDGFPIHKLPKHFDNHRKYSQKVMGDSKDVRDSLQKLVKKAEPCEETETPENLAKELKQYQDSYWKTITESKAENVNDVFRPPRRRKK